jgi:hypothetical protein
MAFPNLSSIAKRTFGPSSVDMEALQRVAEDTGYNLDQLIKVYGYESSYGTDPEMNKGVHQGPFQFSKHLADSLDIDRYDLYESGKAYVTELQTRRKSMESNIENTSGDFTFIDSIDPFVLDYLLHQQGGKGVARLSLAHYSGEQYAGSGDGSQMYMNLIENTLKANLSNDQVKEFEGKKTSKAKVEYFIAKTKENLGE